MNKVYYSSERRAGQINRKEEKDRHMSKGLKRASASKSSPMGSSGSAGPGSGAITPLTPPICVDSQSRPGAVSAAHAAGDPPMRPPRSSRTGHARAPPCNHGS
jgi:hypothetical protein